jgi:choline kinase
MKAVILAAGRGTRIRSVHGEHPKCLIDVDNGTILDHQLDALAMVGINDVAIVVGYEKEQIISHINVRKLLTQRIHFIDNPAFAITNNIYSLWLALDWLHQIFPKDGRCHRGRSGQRILQYRRSGTRERRSSGRLYEY